MSEGPFRYCLNTGTIRGQQLSLIEEIELAGKAGYDGIEPWIAEIEAYVAAGGSLGDLAARIRDRGLRVESAIGFAEWIVDDDAQRKAGLEQARRDMDLVARIGGTRIAAPPAGAIERNDLDLLRAAERYRALLELGEEIGVVPQVEVWGFSKTLSRLGEAVLVAVEAGHPMACILPDVFHLYKGGSPFGGLALLAGPAIHVFHMNDYPAAPPPAQAVDEDRVFPGDGVAPLTSILQGLRDGGCWCALSLELFNPDYYKQDASAVVRVGLDKMKAAVRRALA